MICSLCQREEVLEKVKIWHESETENYDMLWNVQCPVWHVQLRLFILPVSVYGDQPRLPSQAPGSVSSFREIFSPVAAWRRLELWLPVLARGPATCWCWHPLIRRSGHSYPGPGPCRDGVITISLHANPERLWHERLIILLLYLSQNLLDDRVGVNSKYWMVFPALCDYLLQTLF